MAKATPGKGSELRAEKGHLIRLLCQDLLKLLRHISLR